MKIKTDTILYKHGAWHREDEYCFHSHAILPAGLMAESTEVITYPDGVKYFKSKIKGWSSELKFEHVKSAIERVTMTENCKHEDTTTIVINKEKLCTNCNKLLVATWTVKQEPIKVEFDCEWVMGTVIYPVDDKNLGITKKLKPLVQSGKRFHVVATEILEEK